MIKLRELSKFVQDAKPGDHFFFFCKIYLLLNFIIVCIPMTT